MMVPLLRSFALEFVTQKVHEGAQQIFSLNTIETGLFRLRFIRPPPTRLIGHGGPPGNE